MEQKYNQDFKKSETGTALYFKWIRMRKVGCCTEWADDFMEFVKWCFDSGFKDGAALKRHYEEKEYSPQNCFWANRKAEPTKPMKVYEYPSYTDTEFKKRWNNAVNRIREHYGMQPFETEETDFTKRTCKDCVHYKVCKYKRDDVPVCEDYLD